MNQLQDILLAESEDSQKQFFNIFLRFQQNVSPFFQQCPAVSHKHNTPITSCKWPVQRKGLTKHTFSATEKWTCPQIYWHLLWLFLF